MTVSTKTEWLHPVHKFTIKAHESCVLVVVFYLQDQGGYILKEAIL